MTDALETEALATEKSSSVAQLLFKCARIWDELAVAQVRERLDTPALRPAHTKLFPHIDLDGTRLTELAGRLGVSKQAVGQLVDELEEMGFVERFPDPADGRAKLVRFSRRGGRLVLFDGLAVLKDMENELARDFGKRKMTSLAGELRRLLSNLEDYAARQ